MMSDKFRIGIDEKHYVLKDNFGNTRKSMDTL